MVKRILAAWLGDTDLKAMEASVGEASGGDGAAQRLQSPIRVLVGAESFDEIHVLGTRPDTQMKRFAQWLGGTPILHRYTLTDPTDYRAIFRVAKGVLSEIAGQNPKDSYSLSLHLTPGTPTMAAVWLLLGKSLFPARFYQTYRGAAREVDIPFDIAVDYLQPTLRGADIQLQALAAQWPLPGFENLTGQCPALRDAIRRAEKAARREVPVLILGESGTGKELVARGIHEASPRHDHPFLAINCAAMPRELLESELFGHKRGAFTGADKDRKGAFAEADGGTLFLDEIGDCDAILQAKLLRVLEPAGGGGPCRRSFQPVGTSTAQVSDVRIIAATNRPLQEQVQQGRFRLDLYHRLAVVVVHLPPLRQRGPDRLELARTLLQRIDRELQGTANRLEQKKLSLSAKKFVEDYAWPGNIRELYNVLLQAAVLADGPEINGADLAAGIGAVASSDDLYGEIPAGFDLEKHLEQIRRGFIQQALRSAHNHKTQAARLLGFRHYQTLVQQMQRLGIVPPPAR